MKNWVAGALLSIWALAAGAASEQGEGCHLARYEGPLRCITVKAPLDYSAAGEVLPLHVAVAPAFRENARPDPLFVLAGGPGQPGSDLVYLLDSAFRRVRATRDIVFVDQRGAGRSGKLACENLQELESLAEDRQERALIDCLRGLNKPFRHYTTANAARDLDAVRESLGYAQINVWGGSYGTRLGQAYARAYPDKVRSVILDAVASPEQILGVWGADAQASLDALFKRCEQDEGCKQAFPDFRGRFASLLKTVESGQASLRLLHPRTAQPVSQELSRAVFVETVRTALYSADMSAQLPFLIEQAETGSWRPFMAQSYTQSDWSFETMAFGLTMAVVCAEDTPRLTPETIAAEEKNSFLQGGQIKRWPSLCKSIDVPAVPYEKPSIIDAPVLLLSGALDPVTPPHRAEEAMKSMRHSQHFVVDTVGHGVSHLGCGPRLLREFLDEPTKPVNGECLKDIPLPPFMLTAAGPSP